MNVDEARFAATAVTLLPPAPNDDRWIDRMTIIRNLITNGEFLADRLMSEEQDRVLETVAQLSSRTVANRVMLEVQGRR